MGVFWSVGGGLADESTVGRSRNALYFVGNLPRRAHMREREEGAEEEEEEVISLFIQQLGSIPCIVACLFPTILQRSTFRLLRKKGVRDKAFETLQFQHAFISLTFSLCFIACTEVSNGRLTVTGVRFGYQVQVCAPSSALYHRENSRHSHPLCSKVRWKRPPNKERKGLVGDRPNQ